MENRKNILIIIFIITTLIASILAIYFKITSNNQITILNSKINELTSTSPKEITKTEVKQIEKEVEKIVEKISALNFDYKKGKNIENTENYNGSIAYVANIGKEVNLLIKDGIATISNNVVNTNGKKVKDGMLGKFYNGLDCVFLILEDGTVQRNELNYNESTDTVSIRENKNYENINNIVRLALIINNGGKRLPIAIDSDGNYYSLAF